MKKFYISLNSIILTFFSATCLSCCAEDFFIDTQFRELKNNQPKIIQKISETKEVAKEKIKEKKSWFSKKEKKKKITGFETKKRFNPETNETEEIPRGYYGTLPNIQEDFKYKQQTSSSPKQIDALPLDEVDKETFKPAPFDDSLFLDVIIKKQEDSTYLKDLHKIKFTLNNLKDCIENSCDIQKYNATVNLLDLQCKNLKTKYENKIEETKESYLELLNTNYYAKTLGNLKFDANYYARYIPTNEGQYSKDNITLEEEKLLIRINRTIFLINQEN